jgi:hypothetical protein
MRRITFNGVIAEDLPLLQIAPCLCIKFVCRRLILLDFQWRCTTCVAFASNCILASCQQLPGVLIPFFYELLLLSNICCSLQDWTVSMSWSKGIQRTIGLNSASPVCLLRATCPATAALLDNIYFFPFGGRSSWFWVCKKAHIHCTLMQRSLGDGCNRNDHFCIIKQENAAKG